MITTKIIIGLAVFVIIVICLSIGEEDKRTSTIDPVDEFHKRFK